MPPLPSTVPDRHGHPVAAGDRVRILAVTPDPDLEDDDLEMIAAMIGCTREVDAIDAAGLAWVTMWWNGFDGPITTSVGLAPGQMEKVA